MEKIKLFLKRVWKMVTNPMIGVLPGQIAFFLVLSLFPILMLVGVVASFFSISMDTLISAVETTFPLEVVNVIVPLLEGQGFDFRIGLSMIVGFFIASNGAHSITIGSNLLYGFEKADIVRRRVKALFLIIVMIILFVFTLVILAFGGIILEQLLNLVAPESIWNSLYNALVVARWPVALFIIYFNVKLIYVVAPDKRIYSKTTTKGAIFTTIGWILATAIYSYWFLNFANYDFFYGSLSSVVMLMVWIYALAYILVIGITINANEYRTYMEAKELDKKEE